jgi:uncharacterized protein YjbI with pentapeptide repeats
VKIIKPQKLSLLTRVFEDDGQAYMVVTAMGFFPFASPRKLLHEVAMWKMATASLGRDTVLDAAMSKQRGEVLVAGSAFAIGGPTTATSVRVQIGPVDKQLYVMGDRHWTAAGPSDAVPYTEMPVTWDRAFGGEGYARNPLGRGYKPVEANGRTTHPLPNVEDPKNRVKVPRDRPEPAGFGPLDQTWPQRMDKVGTYDQEWLKTRFPGFAKDFDWEFFNCAPKDQRLQGYFALDEKFRVEGMNARERVLESRLPNITARLFLVRTKEGAPDEFIEATSRLDTVLLFPNIERGIVVFRGMVPVAEDDGADVKHIIAAFEDPASPRSPDHYRAVLARRLDKNRGALESLLDDDLLPPPEPEGEPVPEDDWNDMSKVVEIEELQATYLQRKVDRELARAREQLIAQGLDPAELDRQKPAPAERPPKDLRAFASYLDRVEVQIAAAQKEAAAKEKEGLEQARARCTELGVDFDKLLADGKKGGGGPPKFRADAELDRLRDLELLFANAGGATPEISTKLADPAFLTQLRAAETGLRDTYRRFAHYFPAADVLDGDASAAIRAAVIASHARGESLARRDFTGADLSSLDLAGADLTEALLEGVDFTSAVLRGATLTGAVMARGIFRDADLEGATLVRGNFGGADLTSARLNRADVTEAVFYQADLRGATLAGATIDKVQFFETKLVGVDLSRVRAANLHFLDTDLTGAKFVEAELDTAIFLRCTLDGADFSRAILPKTCIVESRCNGASFHEATLEGTRFALASSFEKGDFRGVKMKQTLLRGCNFAGADFTEARADDCDFSEADLSGSVFYRVSAQRSLFVRTSFRNADARSSSFMYAVLQKAQLHGADFRGVNLFRADMAKVRGDKETNFKDAYLVQIRVVPEKNQAKVVP